MTDVKGNSSSVLSRKILFKTNNLFKTNLKGEIYQEYTYTNKNKNLCKYQRGQ